MEKYKLPVKFKIAVAAALISMLLLTAAMLVYIISANAVWRAVGCGCALVGFVAVAALCKGLPGRSFRLLSAAAAAIYFVCTVAAMYSAVAGAVLLCAAAAVLICAFCTLNYVGWGTVLPSAAGIAAFVCAVLFAPAADFGNMLPAALVCAVLAGVLSGRAAGVALDGRVDCSVRICAAFVGVLVAAAAVLYPFRGADGGRIFSALAAACLYPSFYFVLICGMFNSFALTRPSKPQMNVFARLYCRAFQAGFKLAIPLLPYRQPTPLGGVNEAAELIKSKGKRHALIVTDSNLYKIGLCAPVQRALENSGIACSIYSDTVVNPTTKNCRECADLFIKDGCDCIIAVGGGSAMDCAKGAGALIIKPKKTLFQMRGVLKVFGKLPLFIAVPTTAGTGSETTIAAVITDADTRDKFTIISFCLAPHYAILDPEMTVGLPPQVTSTTGMDALTHAVEAYIGGSTTRLTRRMAVEAVKAIRANLYTAYTQGGNLQARRRMQYAAYCAGLAFTISYVGYVHAVAHSLGGKYNTPHGLANAVILPYVLRRYGADCRKKLARLARESGVADVTHGDMEAAEEFIRFVEKLNADMNIPKKLKVVKGDIPELSRHAAKEANPLYPVPTLMNERALENIYYDIMEQ